MADHNAARPHSSLLTPQSPVFRSLLYLVGFSAVRHARVRQMVGIAISLLLLATLVVALISMNFGWERTGQALNRGYDRFVRFAPSLMGSQLLAGHGPLVSIYVQSPEAAQAVAEGAPLA